jgi:hypothetical protein
MKNKKLAGAVLAITGGSLAMIVLTSQKNILELPALLILIFSLLLSLVGAFIVISTDRKNKNYYLIILIGLTLLLLIPFVEK